jgi:prepilin-type N-terminal cleavage/methylation domain-containing protein
MSVARTLPRAPLRRRSGFTLLEVVIALAILAISLMVLIDAQSTAVLMTVESEKMLTGTYLSQEKMSEAMLRVEKDGFTDGDVDEEGDFSDFGAAEGGMGQGPDFGTAFDGYKWAYTIRKVDIQLGDIGQAADQLKSATGKDDATSDQNTDQRDLSDIGIQPDMISDMLRPYIREVRVLVWWGNDEPDPATCEDCVELVSHVINPSGVVVPGAGTGTEEE